MIFYKELFHNFVKNVCSKRPDMVTFSAIENRHLECLITAHKQNYPMNDEQLCAFAAENGDLKCLKYLHQNGCSWDEWTCACATYTCLVYAHRIAVWLGFA